MPTDEVEIQRGAGRKLPAHRVVLSTGVAALLSRNVSAVFQYAWKGWDRSASILFPPDPQIGFYEMQYVISTNKIG